jgi:transcriptional regulator with XRE-family HTH domain
MVVSIWTRREVRALRIAALRLSQEKFAEKIGYSASGVAKWEHATQDRPVRGESAQDLDETLARLDDEQRARFEEALTLKDDPPRSSARDAPPPPADTAVLDAQEVDDDVKRREFGTAMIDISAAIAAPRTRIGLSDAQRLLDIVDRFVSQDQQQGADTLVDAAKHVYARARAVLETHDFDERSGVAFARATGCMAVRLGWLAYDSDNHELAHHCYHDALAWAAQCGDDGLTVHACLTMALQAVRLSSPENPSARHALRLVARAKDLTHRLPPGRIHALAAAREAMAYAALGERSGFARSMSTAWREMDWAAEREPIEECPTWLQFVSHAEIRFHEAMGYDHLGDAPTAIAAFADVLTHRSRPRNAAGYRASFASMMARAGDVSGAVGEAMPLFTVLGQSVSSKRTLAKLMPVRDATGDRYGEFNDRYDQLTGVRV